MKRVMAMMRRMASETRVVCNKEGDGNGGKSDGYKGDGRVTATRVMAKVKAMMTTSAVAVVEVATAMAMVTATAAVMTTEWGSAKVVKGKQATAKVNSRSSSAQHNNQPTTKQGMAKVAREKQVTPRRDVSLPDRVPLSKLLLPAVILNTVAFSGIHSVGILNDAEGTPETITINIPTHRSMANAGDAPTCHTLLSGRNRSTESMSTEYTIAPTILDSIAARGRPMTSDWLIIIILKPL
jgi:hypothetical protein